MKRFLLALIVIFLSSSAFAKDWFLKDRKFYMITIEANDPEINDPDLEINAGYKFSLGVKINDDPRMLMVGLCKTIFQLEVDAKLPFNEQMTGSISIRLSSADQLKPDKYWKGFYTIINSEVLVKFPTNKEKLLFEKLLAERRKKYCPPAVAWNK